MSALLQRRFFVIVTRGSRREGTVQRRAAVVCLPAHIGASAQASNAFAAIGTRDA
jgi:hypothetical protein